MLWPPNLSFSFFVCYGLGCALSNSLQVAQQDEENVVEELMNRKEVQKFRAEVLATVTDTPGFITLEYVDPPDLVQDLGF